MESKYYRINQDDGIGGCWWLSSPYSEGDDSVWRYVRGLPTGDKQTLLDVEEAGFPLDFTLAQFGAPVLSKKARDVLADILSADVEFVPAKIRGVEGEFWVANACRTIECISEQNSVIQYKFGRKPVVIEMAIHEDAVDGCHMFRVKGWPVPLVVSSVIRQAFLDNALTGAMFRQLIVA